MRFLMIFSWALVCACVWSCGDNNEPTPEKPDYSDTTKWVFCEDFVDAFEVGDPTSDGHVVYAMLRIGSSSILPKNQYVLSLGFRTHRGERGERPVVSRKSSPQEYDSICRSLGITKPFNRYLSRWIYRTGENGERKYHENRMLWRNVIADDIDSVDIVVRDKRGYNGTHPEGSSLNDIAYMNYISVYDYVMNGYSWAGISAGNGFYPCYVPHYFIWARYVFGTYRYDYTFDVPFGQDLINMYNHVRLDNRSRFPLKMVVGNGIWFCFSETPNQANTEIEIIPYIGGRRVWGYMNAYVPMWK